MMIEICELTKRYSGKAAVDDLTFQVRPGEVTGFLGPNGAGKSTTIRMLLGLSKPDTGTATIQGMTYGELVAPMRQVGAVTELADPHGDMTAESHLRWVAICGGADSANIGRALDNVGLGRARRQRFKTFSLGMKQRLRLAAALVCEPDVLVLDEPTNGLDPEGIRWMRKLFRRLANDGKTVFLSSHLLSEMAISADHLIVIDRGRLLSDSSTTDFLDAHAGTRVIVEAVRPQGLARALRVAGCEVTENEDGSLDVEKTEVSEVKQIAAEANETIEQISVQNQSLEDAFFSAIDGAS